MDGWRQNQFIIPAALIGLGLILAASVGSYTFYLVRSFDNVLSVTGSAKTHVTSDSAKWTINFSRKVTEFSLQAGYPLLASDLRRVEAFLAASNIPSEAITVSPVFVEEIYLYDPNRSGPREFNLRQTVTVQSNDVRGIGALSKEIDALAAQGVLVSGNFVEYFVTTLPALRVSLLGDALRDARARAGEIASASDQTVGKLKAASSGVVQVLAPNSIDISDYGQYDTQSIEKDVMVTVRGTFFVR